MFAAIAATPQDAFKILLLIAIGGGLLSLGRWSSRLGANQNPDSPANTPTPDPQDFTSLGEATPKGWPPSAEEVAASLPFDPSLGRIRIKRLFFDKTDVYPGPDDPEVFAEEFHIELYDPDSDHSWWQSYFVATPQGLARILREKHWRYLHAPQVLVFPRYDLEEIRRAVVNRIVADNELFRGKEPENEESL
jgi:hypothetical protein